MRIEILRQMTDDELENERYMAWMGMQETLQLAILGDESFLKMYNKFEQNYFDAVQVQEERKQPHDDVIFYE